MKLRHVLLDRVGQRVPLRLEDLARGLNVVFGPRGSGKSTLVRSIVAGLFARRADSPDSYHAAPSGYASPTVADSAVAQLDIIESGYPTDSRFGHAWYSSPRNGGPHESEYRQVFCWQVGGTAWQTLWRIVESRNWAESRDWTESRGWPESRGWGGASSGSRERGVSASDLEWRIRECRERLANFPPLHQDIASLRADRQAWEARLLELRDARTREWDRRDREIRAARRERDTLKSHIERLQGILDRIDQRRERRLDLAEQAWQYDLRYPTTGPNEGTYRGVRRPAGMHGIGESFAVWAQIHRRLLDEISFLQSVLRELPNGSDRHSGSYADRLALLLRSLDVEVQDWEAATHGDPTQRGFGARDVEFDGRTSWIHSDSSTHSARNVRALVDTMLSSLRDDLPNVYPVKQEPAMWREPHGIRLALAYLQRSADALRELLDHEHTFHTEPVVRGYYGDEAWYRENPVREWRHDTRYPGALSLADVRQIHLAAAQHLADRRAKLASSLDQKQRDLHQLRDWTDASWKSSADDELETCQQRVEQIERELNRLDERNRLVRSLEQLERQLGDMRPHNGIGNVTAEASRILQQLTRGLFRAIGVDARGEPYLEEGIHRRDLRTLHGVEHEVVSLSLQLALVGMFLRQGWDMPLLIDELPDGTLFDRRELARILAELSQAGQQILVFTADPEWLREFEGRSVNIYTLVRRTVTERVDPRGEHHDHRPPVSVPNRTQAAPTWPWPRRGDEKATTIPFADLHASSSADRLRFYLNCHDDVVDAPSIGPKTADRLYRIGVRTVHDLLRSDPIGLAQQFGHRHVTADVIRDWQDQARLVCCIPHLRGHDAQLLVACRVRDPQELSRQDASTLWREVDRFADSQEGRRILRNGKKPALSVVQDWIRWARDARALEAA